MTDFAYNNAKNASTGHTLFELNCGYYPQAFYEEDLDLHSQSKSSNQLATELWVLMAVCRENLQHAQKLQKRYYDKHMKFQSYAPGDKVWLNSKYIKTKQNWKLEVKFFETFRVLYSVGKQAYKLELPKEWRIYDVFHMLLLEQNSTRKRRMDKTMTRLEFENDGNGEKYEVEATARSTSSRQFATT